MHSEFLVPAGISHSGSPSLPSWEPHSLPCLSASIPFPLPRKAKVWATVLAGPMRQDLCPLYFFSKSTFHKVVVRV